MKHLIVLTLIVTLTFPAQGQSPIVTKEATPVSREFRPVTGILGAFDEEIRYLLTVVTNKSERVIQQVRFTEADLNGKRVVIAQTGIGKVNAAIATTLMIEHFMPREIVFTGIAGGTNPGLSPGDIVIGSKVAYHDYGTTTPDSLFRRPTRNPFTMKENPIFYLSDRKLVEIAVLVAGKSKVRITEDFEGERATSKGDQWHHRYR